MNGRYYNPLWGRFLNTDSSINEKKEILGYNLYIYCSNNPINNTDSSGNAWLKNIIKKAVKIAKAVKQTARTILNTVSKVASVIFPIAGSLFSNSTNPNPKNVQYGSNSNISNQIKNSQAVKEKLQEIADSNPNSTINLTNQLIEFKKEEDLDLFLSFRHVYLNVSGTLVNGAGNLDVSFKDRYDFKLENETSIPSDTIRFINNTAAVLEYVGVINPYYITVSFDYCVNCCN